MSEMNKVELPPLDINNEDWDTTSDSWCRGENPVISPSQACRERQLIDTLTENQSLSQKLAKANADLAQCYKLSGADPDGDEDWRLAPEAVHEVTRMRQELDENEAENVRLESRLAKAEELLREVLDDDHPSILNKIESYFEEPK